MRSRHLARITAAKRRLGGRAIATAVAAIIGLAAAGSLVSAHAEDIALATLEADAAYGSHLAAGEYSWHGERARSGAVLVSIGLEDQLIHVYRDGILIGASTISSGRPGYETPRGVYTILQKKVKHRSNLYDDAPMPFMQRLTWDGVALHAGHLPGRPASHGCVRLPKRFAKLLYEVTRLGTTTIVAEHVVPPARAAALGLYAGPVATSADVLPPPQRSAPREAVETAGPVTTTAELNRAVLRRLSAGSR